MKLSRSLRSCFYWFIEAYSKGELGSRRWDLTNECFDEGVLDWEAYQRAIVDPSVMKQAITVWSNNIQVDTNGVVLNEEGASFGAFQAIRYHFDNTFPYSKIVSSLEHWEVQENEFDHD